ncbi:hypothetical protein U6N30_20910 [Blastococcus brunescens]|uniref:Uncharacterized protein n=1 Tax=Blastococcus brunescens TaxID=1564165 RepID=A0ABZ1B910_9ACTN|nr:hypothetical protein [Blastococcus sp. BMG 8361]WRL67290.1 hypothetical protein U6N30_20910 [Blastococcus sp. BMG 8361]
MQGGGDHGDAEPQPGRRLGRLEGTVGAGEAADEVAERIGHGLGEHLGDADRQCGAQGIAQPSGVLDGDVALLAGDPDLQGAAGGDELVQPLRGHTARGRLRCGEVTDPAQQV